jgi:hypothetical protein
LWHAAPRLVNRWTELKSTPSASRKRGGVKEKPAEEPKAMDADVIPLATKTVRMAHRVHSRKGRERTL